MLNTFITSFKLKTTYKVNSILYAIKQFPILKKIIPYDIYNMNFFKIIGNIISGLIELGKMYLGKFIYLLVMIMLPALLYKIDSSLSFLNIFVFLTLSGGIINSHTFEQSRDKYYAIILMRMDAKKYAIADYYYEMLKTFIGFLPFTFIFCLILDIPLFLSVLLPIFNIMIKFASIASDLKYYKKTGKYNQDLLSKTPEFILFIIFLLCAYLLPFLKIGISPLIFIIIFLISLIIGFIGLKYINNFDEYQNMLKKILSIENIINSEISNEKILKETVTENIEYKNDITSTKKGFAFFHDLFEKRHSKILGKTVQKQLIGIIIVFAILILVTLIYPSVKETINTTILNILPYFVLLMYYLNRGTPLTQAMFMNCDHSMLTYCIYRTPKVILGVFKERLKTLIKYNIVPAILLGICMAILLFITGGTTNNINYLIIIVSIISMSIFFSIHYLVMYYLLQPYNVNTEVKSSTYRTVETITYIISYMLADQAIPVIYFGVATILFSIIYSIVSLVLVYKLAPKTFKLRI